jgi:signal transduction histidine kinase/ActR/RegA family two-component response regulator
LAPHTLRKFLSTLLVILGCAISFPHLEVRAQVVFGSSPDIAPSADRPWQVQSFAESAGLAQQRIFDVAFASDGTAWFATSNGLWSFDGYRWRGYGPEEGLPSRFVRGVTLTRARELWVATDKGTGVFDAANKRFDTRGSEQHLPNQNVRAVAEFADGSLWFSCDQWPDPAVPTGGLVRFIDGTWTKFDRTNGLPLDYLLGSFRSRRGEMLAFTPRGWVRQLGSQWLPVATSGDELEPVITHAAEAADGRLFLQGEARLYTLAATVASIASEDSVLVTSTRGGGVVSLRREASRNTVTFDEWNGAEFRPSSAPIPVSPRTQFYKLAEAPDGSMWCVGHGVILRWSRQNAWTHYPRLPQVVALDQRGNPWFSGSGQVFWRDSSGFHPVPALRQLLGIDRDDVVIGRDAANHIVTVSAVNPLRAFVTEFPLLSITHVQTESNGMFWAAGRDPQGKLAFTYRDGSRWVLVGAGAWGPRRLLALQPLESGGLLALVPAMQSNDFEAFQVSIAGVLPFDLGESVPALPNPAVHVAGSSTFLAGYSGVFERQKDGRWMRLEDLSGNSFAGLVTRNDVVFTFQNDVKGRGGLALRHGGKWGFVYGEFEAPLLDPADQRLVVTARSRLYRQTVPGSLEFDLLALPEDVYITKAVTDAAGVVWLNTTNGVFSHSPERQPPLSLVRSPSLEVPAMGSLKVEFGARDKLSASSPTHAYLFSHRIDAGPWSAFSTGGEKAIATENLTAGRHRLEVIARNADGIVSSQPAILEFSVQTIPLQDRGWFPYAVTGVVGIVGFFAWLGISRARALVKSHRELAKEFAERERAEQALAQALSDLTQAHNELENRVAERTLELSSANEALRRALAEREESERNRTALEHQLREAQKMEAIGTLAGGIAHDFNNILTVIIPCTGIALGDAKQIPSVRENLTQVLQAAERAKNLVQQILAFSRRQKPEQRPTDLRRLIRETHQLLRSALPSAITLNVRTPTEVPLVMADLTQLHQVLMNLATNARHALPAQGGAITLSLDTLRLNEEEVKLSSDLPAGQYVRISVEDNGRGMSADILPRIFEPFFTTKGPGEGTGLGLSVAHGIIKDHHGAIRVYSREGRGTRFDVLLPPAADTVVEVAVPEAAPSTGHGENILVVDDEFMVSRIVSQVLSRTGYRPSVHTRPEVALSEFLKIPSRFHAMITDLTMPGMNGLELARAVRAIRPDLPILLMTGYGGDVPPGVEAREVDLVVFKPFEAESIVLELEKILARKSKPPVAATRPSSAQRK